MTQPTAACGRQIHMAARALESVRNTALGEVGIAFPYWVVLEAVTEMPRADRKALIQRLVAMTVHDEEGAGRAIDELSDRGLLNTQTDDPGVVELTSQGRALADNVIAKRTGLRERLYGGISPEDIATTTRVLDLITERAGAIHAEQSTALRTT